MRDEDIVKRLENVTVPDIELESHRRELETSLLKEYGPIQALSDRNGMSGWLRAILTSRRVWAVVVPVIAILATVLTLQLTGFFISPSGVLSKAHAATERIESYRTVSDCYTKSAYTDNEPVLMGHSDTEYANLSRYRIIYHGETINSEIIVIGNQVYLKGDAMRPQTPEEVAEGLPSKEQAIEMLDLLINIEGLNDEYIDDTLCYHYRGIIDMDKYLAMFRPKFLEVMESQYELADKLREDVEKREAEQSEKTVLPTTEEVIAESWARVEERMRRDEITWDVWIGKDDYIIRRADSVTRPLEDPLDINKEMIVTWEYSDFYKKIIIEPPLTKTGELEEGWYEMSMDSWLGRD